MPLYNQCLDITLSVCAANSFGVQAFRLTAIVVDFQIGCCISTCDRDVGAIPNFATEKEPKRNFLYLTDVTLVVVDIKSERFIKRTCLQQDLFDMTMVTIMFDTKSSKSESFKCVVVYVHHMYYGYSSYIACS